jgi:rubrerythrin
MAIAGETFEITGNVSGHLEVARFQNAKRLSEYLNGPIKRTYAPEIFEKAKAPWKIKRLYDRYRQVCGVCGFTWKGMRRSFSRLWR